MSKRLAKVVRNLKSFFKTIPADEIDMSKFYLDLEGCGCLFAQRIN